MVYNTRDGTRYRKGGFNVSDQRYLTIEEFCEELEKRGVKFSPRTIRLWVKQGKIKAIRPGERTWYIPESELDRILSDRLPLTPAAPWKVTPA